MDPVEQPSCVIVKSPFSRKNRKVNIEIRDGLWYLLPGTVLCPPVLTFQEHSRRNNIVKNYGREMGKGYVEIIKECPVPGDLSAWHLVQGNNDGVTRFSYEEKEKLPKINLEQTAEDVGVIETDEVDDLVENLRDLEITRCPPHLMRAHHSLPLLYCEHGCGHKINL